jgi:Periplasmic binding proteins and sugar binding domain of LacI family
MRRCANGGVRLSHPLQTARLGATRYRRSHLGTRVRRLDAFTCSRSTHQGAQLPHRGHRAHRPDEDADKLRDIGRRVPAVEIGCSMQGKDFDTVCSADVAGARLAVEHLIALGHQHIAHLDGGHNPGAAERRAGYRAAMEEFGLAGNIN